MLTGVQELLWVQYGWSRFFQVIALPVKGAYRNLKDASDMATDTLHLVYYCKLA